MEWLLLAVSLLLVLVCGVFVAAEFSFVTVNRAVVEVAAGTGDRGAEGVRAALGSLSTQLSGTQVGITLTNLAIGFLAEPAVAELIRGPLGMVGLPAEAVEDVAVALGLVLATAVTMLLGELVPKNIAIAKPLATARAVQGFQRGFTITMSLPIRVLNGSANALVRTLGVEPQEELRSARNSDELVSIIGRSATQGSLDRAMAGLMQRSVAFSHRTAGAIMTPRVRVVTVGQDEPVAGVVALARGTGHSRFPVLGDGLDDAVGAVHVKHAVAVPASQRAGTRVRDVMVPVSLVPETLPLDPLMVRLRDRGFQLAVVLDEYGGTAGLATLEDVVEEIVGEISDEHDRLDTGVRRDPEGGWSVSGLLRPDEVASSTGIELPEHQDYDTVAGLILQGLGRIAQPGDSVGVALSTRVDEHGVPGPARRAVLTVQRMAGLRVELVHLTVVEEGDEGAGGGE